MTASFFPPDRHYFNPRSREGSDCNALLIVRHGTQFQSTLPRGERRTRHIIRAGMPNFNPRSREGSDHSPEHFATAVFRFQSTLPRGERQFFSFFFKAHTAISIHAPARGATRRGLPEIHNSNISIHAPARGATVFIICTLL